MTLALRPLARPLVLAAQPPAPVGEGRGGVDPGRPASGQAWRALVVLMCWVLAGPALAQSFELATVRDPKASFFDVVARTAWLRAHPGDARLLSSRPAAVDCTLLSAVPAPVGPMVIPPHYAKGNHGPMHPDYEAAVAPYRAFEDRAALLANLYVATGEAGYARCLLDQLDQWARAGALLDYTVRDGAGESKQVWYQVEWSTGAAALALSQIMTEPGLDGLKRGRVLTWLNQVSHKQISFPGGDSTCCNNHAYWRGLHATMVGVLSGDDGLFRWGLGRYAVAIDQLAADGSWPLEMARHEQALHYQNFALLPLVLTAEIAARQGVNLYAYQHQGRDLHSAVRFLASALALATRPGAPAQDLNLQAFAPGRSDQTWAEFYRARFGQDPLGLLSQAVFNARTGGNATLLVYQPPAQEKTRP